MLRKSQTNEKYSYRKTTVFVLGAGIIYARFRYQLQQDWQGYRCAGNRAW